MSSLFDSEPGVWYAELPGDSVAGKIVKIEIVEGMYGKFRVLTLEQDLEPMVGILIQVNCSRADLKRQITDLRPQVGQYLGVVYQGSTPMWDGKLRHKYQMMLANKSPWSEMDKC